MRIEIRDIAYHLPAHMVTNEDLHRQNPDWNMAIVGERAGVLRRHFAADNETAVDLAVAACQRLFRDHPDLPPHVDGVIFCTQSPDYIMPPNACVVHAQLGLAERALAFDINLACSGYVYGLALSASLISSGLAHNILLITADTYSKYIHPQDRATKTLFGDAAAVSWIAESSGASRVTDVELSTAGKDFAKFYIPAGGFRTPRSPSTKQETRDQSGNVRTSENIYMDGRGVLAFVNTHVPAQIKTVLERNELRTEDIDLFVFHQGSRMVLDSLARILRLPPEKVYSNIDRVGNTVSASIPLALKDAVEEGYLHRGDRIVLCGFGVGLSMGTVLLTY